MQLISKFLLIILVYLSIFQTTKAEQILKYANMDQVIKETKIGSEMIIKINEIDQENMKKLSSYEEELKSIENEIKLKKNIISEEEFEKEINDLKKKITVFNKEKNQMIKNFNNIKKKELKILFDTINPIVQNYMDENSIDIIFNSKNIYIGNKKSDLTRVLIEEINNNIKE